MKRMVSVWIVVTLLASLSGIVWADIKCPVSNEEIDEEVTIDYKGGKLYFCCEQCIEPFQADQDKYAAKANHQLVATKQAKQTSCPVTGRPTKKETVISVAGVDVGFCCERCQGKVQKAALDEQLKMVFANAPFAKAFKVGAADN
jgi:YHS domain-containing protein